MSDTDAPIERQDLADDASEAKLDKLSCDLECRNGGYCTLRTEDDEAELIRAALRGELLEQCICRPGFAGIACEQEVKECELDEGGRRTCHNGAPCTASGTDEDGVTTYTCDCSIASAVSPFAGAMCKKPATEYCGREGESIADSFCTNGGTCTSNLSGKIQAKVPFQHNGCVCAVEFEGDHCEYLKSIYLVSDEDRPAGAKFGIAVGVMILCIVVLYSARGLMRRSKRRKMWDTMSEFFPAADQHDLSFEEEIEYPPRPLSFTDEEEETDASKPVGLKPIKII